MELKIRSVTQDSRYPDGVKYGLIFKDLKSGNKVLLDNHHPKGPHVHLGEKQIDYEYVDDDTLISDFKKYVFQHMGVKL